jgi:LysM repeat protein
MASQAALESRWGSTDLGNNLFGIKAGSSWKGPTVTAKTREIVKGKPVTVKAKFRAYPSTEASIADRIAFMQRNYPEFNAAATVGDALEALKNGKYGSYYTEKQDVYEKTVNDLNEQYLGGSPVPPGGINPDVAPVTPATMSRELAYVRGLANSPAALEAINRATGAGATQGLDAYMGGASGGLSASPVAPKTDTSAFAPRAQALPPSAPGNRNIPLPDLNSPLYKGQIFGSDASSPYLVPGIAEGEQRVNETADWMRNEAPELPYPTLPRLNEPGRESAVQRTMGTPDLAALDAAMRPSRIPGTRTEPLENTAFASDLALKRLAAAKDPNSGLFTGNISAGPYNPQATMDTMAGQKAQAAPRITLADVMNGMPANNAPAPIRTTGLAGSNTEPLSGRPASLGPAPKQDPLLAWAAGNQAAPRAVTNLVTPTGASIPPNTGVGFGQTPVGSIQPAPFINPAIAAPKPATQSAAPTVNSKGFFLGNPVGDYAVKSGETLGKIAKKFGTTVDNLAAVNNIPDPAKVKAGARLVVTNPSVAPVTPAARINRPSTSSSSTTPVSTYRPATTSQPVSISNPVIKAPVVKPVATAPKPTYTLGQLMGTSFASGGAIPGYAAGSSVTGGGVAFDPIKLQNAYNTVKAAELAGSFIPGVNIGLAAAHTFAPTQTQATEWQLAAKLASPSSGGSTTRSSTPMMDGSPSSSSRNTSGSRKDNNDGAKSGGSSSGSSGGIDGVIGTYNPPTQAQIDAMYAPYFKPAVMPPAGYNPGVSGEFNYFPGSGPTAPVSNPMIQGTTPPAATAGAADWYNKFVNSMKSTKDRQAAKKVMAKDNTSYYDLFRQYQETLGRKASPTLEGWQSWLTTKGFATGGAVSEPRLVLGKGGPTADKIPAKIDGVHEARLSNGEFVMTAAAVRGLGGGDYHRGAEALMKLNDQFAPRQDKGTLKVEKVR